VRSLVIDGEIVACDDAGLPDFYALHFRTRSRLCVWASQDEINRKQVPRSSGGFVPSKKDEPSPAEQDILDKHLDRTRNNPAPDETFKLTHDGENLKSIVINHPDPDVGAVLAMDAVGTTSHSLFRGLVAQLVELGAYNQYMKAS
jgi:hypothetical protein